MTVEEAVAELSSFSQPGRPVEMEAYHKIARPYLGVANPDTNAVVARWRDKLTLEERIDLAAGLWQTNIYEARVAAAKLLTQARIRPDTAVWDLIASWVPEFDSWAIADHASKAGERRLVADPTRLDLAETWVTSDHMWTRRAALVMTLPWAKFSNPKQEQDTQRERIMGWAATLADDHDWFIQKAVAWWLRDLSKHQPDRTRAFLELHGQRLKPFARKEAARLLA